MCLGNTVKTKENQFLSFSRKDRPCWEKIPVPLIAWYDDTHSYKIHILRLHKQKNERETQVFLPKPNIPFKKFIYFYNKKHSSPKEME